MGRAFRIAAPRKAKIAKRAVTRPAKTARQAMTPRPVKKATSTSWRFAHPKAGIRQEVEGRAIGATRRGLFGPRADRVAKPIEQATRDGWRPESVSFDQVPVLCDCTQFHEIEAERIAAVARLGHGGAESELATLRFAVWTRQAQLDLVTKLAQLIAEEPDPTREEYVRYIAWARSWPPTTLAEVKAWIGQTEAIEAVLGPENAGLVLAHVSERVNAVLARTVPALGGT